MTFGEVHGRIEMRAAMLRRRVAVSRVEVALVGYSFEISFEFELLGSGPVNTISAERIRQIEDTTIRKTARCLRENGNREHHNNHKQVQTLHAECSLGLGFWYLHANPQT